jgi:hypothetical protein
MISTDLIVVVTPWIIFGSALIIVCVRLARARRADQPPQPPPDAREERCPEQNQTAPKR